MAEQARAEQAGKTAVAERRARRRMMWAALAVLLLVVGAGSGAWWLQRKQALADQAVLNGVGQAELLEKQAQEHRWNRASSIRRWRRRASLPILPRVHRTRCVCGPRSWSTGLSWRKLPLSAIIGS